MNDNQPDVGLSAEELDAQGATALPDKEVVSILDLNADINLAIDAAAPIDLAVAANANVAAPIDAAVGANVLSVDSTAQALSDQGVIINQGLDADASAHAVQDSDLDQSNDVVDAAARRPGGRGTAPAGSRRRPRPTSRRRHATPLGRRARRCRRRRRPARSATRPARSATRSAAPWATDGHRRWRVGDATGGTVGDTTGTVRRRRPAARSAARPVGSVAPSTVPPATVGGAVGGVDGAGGLLDGNLLNVDVNVDADADIAAPINGAVAANANVAAPIDAAVGANIGSVGSDAIAVSQQDAIINQDITGSAEATSDQTSDITAVAPDDGPSRPVDGTRRRCRRRRRPVAGAPVRADGVRADRARWSAPATASRRPSPAAATARRSSSPRCSTSCWPRSTAGATYDEVGERVGAAYGRTVTGDNVRTLVDQQLRPMGLLAKEDGSQPEVKKSNPLLALRFKYAVSDPERTRRLTSPFARLFNPVVVAVVMAAFLVSSAGGCSSRRAWRPRRTRPSTSPGLLLLVVAVTVLSAGFHEFGHAAGARRGGATPGVMGAGVYLVWPAFYTDVTDSYRLGRGGRVRTDLGGLYFNAIVAVGIAGVWWATGYDALLLVVATQILQMVRQLTPLVRFDGYHVLADVTGVPDLFHRIRPTLLGVLPWRWRHPESTVLKPWARAVVTRGCWSWCRCWRSRCSPWSSRCRASWAPPGRASASSPPCWDAPGATPTSSRSLPGPSRSSR